MDSGARVEKCFLRLVDRRPTHVIAAPGRINLIGEHTDYNGGLVMPAAIEMSMYFAVAANGSDTVRAYAVDFDEEISFLLTDKSKDSRSWVNYCKGIVTTLRFAGYEIGGFDIVFVSDIPIGAGLSSSAALDCGLLKSIDQVFALGLSDWDIVTIANRSDNTFLGIPSGILDQFACTFGKADQCMMMRCGDRAFEYVPAALREHQLVLIDSNVVHDHTSSGYSDGPKECQEALYLLQKIYPSLTSLSDCTAEMVAESSDLLPPHLCDRASYIVAENKRVLAFREAFRTEDIIMMGELLYASHDGLSHKYRVSCPELDLLVGYAKEEPAIIGARMMGGGFGGCTLNLVRKDSSAQLRRICDRYEAATNLVPKLYYVSIGQGLRVISDLSLA